MTGRNRQRRKPFDLIVKKDKNEKEADFFPADFFAVATTNWFRVNLDLTQATVKHNGTHSFQNIAAIH
jgi:hypothetical protein